VFFSSFFLPLSLARSLFVSRLSITTWILIFVPGCGETPELPASERQTSCERVVRGEGKRREQCELGRSKLDTRSKRR